MSECVIVLGPYRSGTSLTAQVVERLGVDFGPRDEQIGTNAFNPGGYRERGDINELNRLLITSAGGTLGSPGDPGRLIDLADRSILHGVRLPWPGHRSVWGLKDPRFCATLSLWIETGSLKADSIRIVKVTRDPEAVVRSSLEHPSVQKFCGRDPVAARTMVDAYLELAEWQVRMLRVPSYHLGYEELLADPRGEVSRLANWLGVDDEALIRQGTRCVGKQAARGRYYLSRSLTFPFRVARKAYWFTRRSSALSVSG